MPDFDFSATFVHSTSSTNATTWFELTCSPVLSSLLQRLRSHRKLLRAGCVLSLGLCTSTLCWAQSSAANAADAYLHESAACGFIKLTDSIYSSSSGAWSLDAQGIARLAMVDIYRQDILAIDATGALETALGSPTLRAPLAGARPARICSNDGYLVVQDQMSGEMINLTFGTPGFNRLAYQAPESTLWSQGPEKAPIPGRIINLYGWTLLDLDPDAPDSAPGFAAMVDFAATDGDEFVAFVVFDTNLDGRIVKDYRDPELIEVSNKIFYRSTYFDFPYFATAGNKAYVLFLEEPLRLGEISADSTEPRWLESFPDALKTVAPVIRNPRMEMAGLGPMLATQSLQTFESSESLAGIYGVDDRLFVLFKEAKDAEDQTRWWLYELSTLTGETIARFPVPSGAAHLTAVPGQTWAFLEKSSVSPIGASNAPFRNIDSLTTVSMERLPELNEKSADHCLKVGQEPRDEGTLTAFLRKIW